MRCFSTIVQYLYVYGMLQYFSFNVYINLVLWNIVYNSGNFFGCKFEYISRGYIILYTLKAELVINCNAPSLAGFSGKCMTILITGLIAIDGK